MHSIDATVPEIDLESKPQRRPHREDVRPAAEREFPENTVLLTLLVCSMAVWFFALGNPLWLDETISYWQTQGGFYQLWDRQGSILFVAYPFILWLTKTLFGSSLVALRAPSILAMAGAVIFLYYAAREFFDRNISLIVAIVFSLHPIVIFAAIDARAYAMSILACTASTYYLLRWLRTHETRDAVLCGLTAGLIAWFEYLFVTLIPAFLLILIAAKPSWKSFPRQFAKLVAVFTAVMLPIAFRFLLLVETRKSHVFEPAPRDYHFLQTFAPGNLFLIFGTVLLIAALFRTFSPPTADSTDTIVRCGALAFVPLLTLYFASTLTSIHIFTERYRLVALPGVALCWGWLVTRLNSKALRILFTMVLVIVVARAQYDAPFHGHSWKGATEVVNRATASDHAPVLVCSNLVESDFEPMPKGDVTGTWLFAQFSYYPIHTTVVPLPRTLNPRSEGLIRDFLRTAVPAHQRFLAMGHGDSRMVLHWIEVQLQNTYTARDLGLFNGVAVVEYDPKQPETTQISSASRVPAVHRRSRSMDLHW